MSRRLTKRIGTNTYVLGVGKPSKLGKRNRRWIKVKQDRSELFSSKINTLEESNNMNFQQDTKRTQGLNFLDDIKHIRRLDFIDGDLSLLWDQFIIKNVRSETALYHSRADGILPENITREELVTKLTSEFGLKLFIKNIEREEDTQKISSEMNLFCSEHVQVQLSFWNTQGYSSQDIKYEANGIGIGFISNNLEIFNKLEKICAEFVHVKKNEGCIYVLKKSGNGLTLGEAGYAAELLIPDNYTPEVMDKYQHMLEDLKAKKPCGRLNVVSGPPGGGKSYLLKSLLKHSEDLMFILVRPEFITALGDPEFVTVLINQRDKDKPYVFIIEDADTILSERMADNMGSISAILNTSDGILGSTLDLRIIASTNAAKVDFDSAVLRPGRLCTHIEVGKISSEQAHKIFLRETGKELKEAEMEIKSDPNMLAKASKIGFGKNLESHKGFTLAEVYKTIYLYNKTLEK